MKQNIDKLDFITIKNSHSEKDVKRMSRQVTDREEIFVKGISDKDLLTKIKNCENSTIRKQLKNEQKFTKDDVQIANKHVKRCSMPYVTRELQIEITQYHHILIKMVKI